MPKVSHTLALFQRKNYEGGQGVNQKERLSVHNGFPKHNYLEDSICYKVR